MRVFLTGASGTGKTSVGSILADKLDLVHMPSVARSCPYEHGTVDAQLWIQQELVKVANDSGVHDRTLIDVYGYDVAYGDRGDEGMYDLYPQLLLDVTSWVYDSPIIIYFPILFDAVEDGVRPTDKEFNTDVDLAIKAALDVLVTDRFFEVGEGTPEERADAIVEYIQNVTH